MDALSTLAMAMAFGLSPPGTVSRWHPYIDEASRRFGVPSAWVERVMRAESGGETRRYGLPIRSRAGAMGLMQLMPSTWRQMHDALMLGADPDDPRDNIFAGTFYLRLMYDRFGYPGLFAAYNAGPARYAAHLGTGAPLPSETRDYLAKVAPSTVSSDASDASDALFAVATADHRPDDARGILFVPLSHAPGSGP